MVNSGEFGARNDGATPISNRRALSDDVPNFSSIDYITLPIQVNSLCHQLIMVHNYYVHCRINDYQ
nr:palindromic element RPE2 domain-containing protein [Rickettsia endosymbiont of Oedothorax gibbosus]